MPKVKVTIHLDPTVVAALSAYQQRHRRELPTRSAVVGHLLRRELLAAVDADLDDLLAPLVARAVENAAGQVVREEVQILLRAQTDRLAALLVRSGKDARTSASLGTAILERLTGDRTLARRLAKEARLAAGPAYTANGLHTAGED